MILSFCNPGFTNSSASFSYDVGVVVISRADTGAAGLLAKRGGGVWVCLGIILLYLLLSQVVLNIKLWDLDVIWSLQRPTPKLGSVSKFPTLNVFESYSWCLMLMSDLHFP